MTAIEHICVKCETLHHCHDSWCIDNRGKRYLISYCLKGGKNAGNRKTCKRFKQASDDIITDRLNILKGVVTE